MKKKYLIAGGTGLVGSAIVRQLESKSFDYLSVNRNIVDLRNTNETQKIFAEYMPDVVICAAASVGGILKNSNFPADMMMDNLLIQNSIFTASHKLGIERLVFLGSSCIYPRNATQPIKEEYLLTGSLEVTNEAYAIAKIAGIFQVKAFRRQYGRRWISFMPTNLYGPNDNFDLRNSHVMPALIRKIVEAKLLSKRSVEVWGRKDTLREFLFAEDLARAVLYLEDIYDGSEPLNIGSGEEISIIKLVDLIAESIGYEGEILFNDEMPSGTPRKLLDSHKVKSLGWKPTVQLREGIQITIEWYLANRENILNEES